MNFTYNIGDSVMRTNDVAGMLFEMEHTEHVSHLHPSMRIIERRSVECIAGTQLGYLCETWQGQTMIFAQESLLPAEQAWDQWADALILQEQRSKAGKEQHP